MALTWPLPVSEFFDMIPVSRITARPGRAVSFSETGGGDVIAHKVGARLWRGEVTLDKDYHSVLAAIEARLSLLEEPGASLLLYDTRQPFPLADPGGLLLGSATPRIAALNANNRELTLKNLPAGYVLSTGDLLGFTYGTNPVRRAFHRVVTGGVADQFGITPEIELTPFIRKGAAVDAAVHLIRPPLKAVIHTAEYGAGRSLVSLGGKFSWTQVLR